MNAVSNMVTKETWKTAKGAGVKGMRHASLTLLCYQRFH